MIEVSVIYRTGRITDTDYDEAIEALQDAKKQHETTMCCTICTGGDHTAESCHHNPLLAARRYAEATHIYVCYHCGYIAHNDEEAKRHFGPNDSLYMPECLLRFLDK